jgi:hypothetical protein
LFHIEDSWRLAGYVLASSKQKGKRKWKQGNYIENSDLRRVPLANDRGSENHQIEENQYVA